MSEEAYQEALRRIREAEKTGALELDPSGAKDGETGAKEDSELAPLNRLPRELERLTFAPNSRSLLLPPSSAIYPRWPASPRSKGSILTVCRIRE